ncbi:MAG: VCBS repeat-containing protein, partial [Planctomycetes bacterium]|nr:VCBS repeat-containing protein [Planctomycetota bacterium]
MVAPKLLNWVGVLLLGGTILVAQATPTLVHGGCVILTSGMAPKGVADVDGDGDQDLLFINSATATVTILLSDVGGNPGIIANIPVGALPVAIGAGDLDGDGDDDLVTYNSGSSSLSVLISTAPGQFTRTDVLSVPAMPDFVIKDFEGDGDLDFISRTGHVYLGNGTGALIASSFMALGFSSSAPQGSWPVHIFDIDGDSDMDFVQLQSIVGGSISSKRIRAWINTGASLPVVQDVMEGPWEWRALCPGDFDADGDMDLAIVDQFLSPGAQRTSLVVWRQDSPLAYSQGYKVSLQYPTVSLVQINDADLTAADFNGDGFDDVCLFARAEGVTPNTPALQVCFGNVE